MSILFHLLVHSYHYTFVSDVLRFQQGIGLATVGGMSGPGWHQSWCIPAWLGGKIHLAVECSPGCHLSDFKCHLMPDECRVVGILAANQWIHCKRFKPHQVSTMW